MKRFFDKVDKINGCWVWTGCLRGKTGYGAFKINGKTINAHRVSYELHYGEIPDGMYVCHKCDNRKCVNPSHLFLGTAKDNWNDGFSKGRIKLTGGIKNKPAKHPSNYSYKKGCRCKECKAIHNDLARKYRSKIKNKSQVAELIDAHS